MIANDDPGKLAKLSREKNLEFPILVDTQAATIRSYGILNVAQGGIPHPTALVIDRDGVVRYARIDEDYTVRPTPEELFEALRSLETEALPQVALATELGEIVVEIDSSRAPLTAANFLAHVDRGLFAGAHFYRVVRLDNQADNEVRIEVIQGGLGFDSEAPLAPIRHETTAETGLAHRDGTLSMARLEPGTASSEFFICIGDQPELDFGGARNPDGQGFAAFGRVVEGMETVRAIQRQEADGQMLVSPVRIDSARRIEQLSSAPPIE